MPKVLALSGGQMVEINVTAGSANVGVGVVDFGTGATDAKLVVTGQAGILAGSFVSATLTATATASHSADEHMVDGPIVMAGDIVPGVGFTVFASTRNTRLFGAYSVSWSWV
jgi:hypothetical protein